MTDNIFITGAATGAFTEALADLPPWATEDTANKIANILQKTLALQTKNLTNLVKGSSGKGQTPDQIKKVNDELDKIIKNYKKENEEQTKKKKYRGDEDIYENKRKKYRKSEEVSYAKGAIFGIMLEKLGIGVEKTFRESFDTYTNLNAAGMDLISGFDKTNTGFDSLAQLSTLTGVKFTELQATMLKYNTAINAFTAFKFAKTVGRASAELAQFGYSTKESAELLGAYLESQQGFTDNRNKSEEQVSKDLVGFGQRIANVSLATGMMREKILANLDALSQSIEATILTGQVGEQASEKLLEFAASFKDQKLGNEFLTMMTDAIKPLNETFQHLQKAGDGAFGQMEMQFVQRLKESGASPEEMQKQTAEWVSANKSGIQQMIQRNNLLAQAGNTDARAANEHLKLLLQQERTYHDISASDHARIDATNKARADFSSAWEKLLSSLQRVMVPLIPIMNVLGSAIGWIADAISGTAKLIDWLGDHTLLPIIHTLQGLGDILGITTGKIESIHLASVLGTLAAGAVIAIGGLKMLGFSLSSLTKGLGGLISKVLGRGGKTGAKGMVSEAAEGIGGSKGGKGGLLSSIGKGIGDIGKGLGAGLGGLLKGFLTGLAAGLKALGSPQVLLGVVSLAGLAGALWVTGKAVKEFIGIKWEDMAKAGTALVGLTIIGKMLSKSAPEMIIGAIGLGILSGALWVTGKAVKEFISISWGDLGKSATAIVGLGVAGATAGALSELIFLGAAALAAMGGALWIIGEAFRAVGPGLKMTADGIREFGNIDGKNLISVAQGLVALGGALVIFSAGSIASSVGGVLSTLTGGFSKLFGDGSLLDQLKSFAAIGPGLMQAGTGISILSGSITSLGSALGALSGLDKLKDIVSTVNSLDLLKAIAIGTIGSSAKVSLPTPTPTTGVSNPTSPKPSTLNSPSQVSTKQSVESEKAQSKEPTKSVGAGVEKAANDSSVSTVLGYQSSLMEQYLLKMNDLISVNKDLLKYAKINT